MRIRDVSGDRLERVRLQESFAEAQAALAGIRKLLDALPHPAWTRGRDGRLTWRSVAFAQALEPKDAQDRRCRRPNCSTARTLRESEEARARLAASGSARVHATVAGARRPFEVFEVASEGGSVGIAIDLTESEALRAENDRRNGAYKSLLDRLATAVAIFDRGKRLDFYNAAYRQIWSLDPAFLDQQPDRRRNPRPSARPPPASRAGRLPRLEGADAVDLSSDGAGRDASGICRTAARCASPPSPNAEGGVTYLYDDATQSFALAAQLNALTRLQGETLDALKEGVAVFGADGRLQARQSRLRRRSGASRRRRRASGRISTKSRKRVCRWCPIPVEMGESCAARRSASSTSVGRWPSASNAPTACVLECAALPLPDGGTLMTFLDMTDSANVERALTERNEALVSAEKLRNDFVKHVSYELRTPLTNIIGFTQLLADGGAGALTAKQLEYAGYIRSSSSALLAIINDILDLASIDAGALELRLEDVDVAEAMKAAAEGRAGPAARGQYRIAHRRHRRRRQLQRRRAAGAAGAVQPALQRHRLLRAGTDRDAGGDAAPRRGRVQGLRSRPRHSARGAGESVRPFRGQQRRHPPSRPRARPVDRSGAGRVARRPRDDRFRGRGGHGRHLRFPYPGRRLAALAAS